MRSRLHEGRGIVLQVLDGRQALLGPAQDGQQRMLVRRSRDQRSPGGRRRPRQYRRDLRLPGGRSRGVVGERRDGWIRDGARRWRLCENHGNGEHDAAGRRGRQSRQPPPLPWRHPRINTDVVKHFVARTVRLVPGQVVEARFLPPGSYCRLFRPMLKYMIYRGERQIFLPRQRSGSAGRHNRHRCALPAPQPTRISGGTPRAAKGVGCCVTPFTSFRACHPRVN